MYKKFVRFESLKKQVSVTQKQVSVTLPQVQNLDTWNIAFPEAKVHFLGAMFWKNEHFVEQTSTCQLYQKTRFYSSQCSTKLCDDVTKCKFWTGWKTKHKSFAMHILPFSQNV